MTMADPPLFVFGERLQSAALDLLSLRVNDYLKILSGFLQFDKDTFWIIHLVCLIMIYLQKPRDQAEA